MTGRSDSAMAYVHVQRRTKDAATWMDVADAYDAGMRHGLEARRNAAKQVQQIAARAERCVICGFAAGMAIHIAEHLYGKPSPGGIKYHAFKSEAA